MQGSGRRLAPGLVRAGASVVLAVAALAMPAAAQAHVSGDGFGVANPIGSTADTNPADALDTSFTALQPSHYRFIAYWNLMDDPGWRAGARAFVQRAVAAGASDIAVSFGPPPTPIDATTWDVKVNEFITFIKPHAPEAQWWWSPANEPNDQGAGWMRLTPHDGGIGSTRLAEYSQKLQWRLAISHPGHKQLSPDFADEYVGGLEGLNTSLVTRQAHSGHAAMSTVAHYLRHYTEAGGVLGDMVAWHPYHGVRRMNLNSTTDLIDALPQGTNIWLTEIGSLISRSNGFQQTPAEQNAQVNWIVGTLTQRSQVKRASYYHLRDHNPAWDSGLLDAGGVRRPAYFTWCYARHGGGHPLCSAGSFLTSDPAAVATKRDGSWNGLVAFARANDLSIWHRSLHNGQWGPWQSLGGQMWSAPAAVTLTENGSLQGLVLFAVGTDRQMWHKSLWDGQWSDWVPLGGCFNAGPAAASPQTNGSLEGLIVVGRACDGSMNAREIWNGQWGSWYSLGGQFHSDPSAVYLGKNGTRNGLLVFGKGTDGALYHKSLYDNQWSNWQSLGGPVGGQIASAPSAVTVRQDGEANGLVVFARGGDGQLWHRSIWDHAWGSWQPLGGGLTSGPAATSPGTDKLVVFARGSNYGLTHRSLDLATGWSNWVPLGSP
jgi:repeat uncharacterized protein DUF346/putative glycosyl hydrolase